MYYNTVGILFSRRNEYLYFVRITAETALDCCVFGVNETDLMF